MTDGTTTTRVHDPAPDDADIRLPIHYANMEATPVEAALFAAQERARLARQRLPAVQTIDPYGQGELDGLCGLYAAVNALRLIAIGRDAPLSDDRCVQLFRHGASFLNEQGKLSAAVRYGLRWRMWVKLVTELTTKAGRMVGGKIPLHQPFAGIDSIERLIFVSHVRTILHDNAAALVLLKGAYEHYSVICGLSDTRLRLFDSYGYRWVTLAACATSPDERAKHRIHIPSLLVMGP